MSVRATFQAGLLVLAASTSLLGCAERCVFATDADSDGHGDSTASVTAACGPPPDGAASRADDCDDADPVVYPGALEICDGKDSDCNGAVDDDPATWPTWCLDLDGDQYGDETQAVTGCDAPLGYLGDCTDCDDGAFLVNPGGTDYCGDGIDQDCSGADTRCTTAYDVDDVGIRVGAADVTLSGGMVNVGDQDGDGSPDLLLGADEEALLVRGPIVEPRDLSVANAALQMASGHMSNVAPAGDVDGDGRADMLVADSSAEVEGEMLGEVVLFLGPVSGETDQAAAAAVLLGESAYGATGGGLASGDLDADGYSDVLVGAPDAMSLGAVYVEYGPVSGERGLSEADVRITGSGDSSGGSLASPGDTNADGFPDLVVGAPSSSSVQTAAGAAYLFFPPLEARMETSDADATLLADTAWGVAGSGTNSAGDVNADGYDDFVVSASNSAIAWIVQGPITGTAMFGDVAVASVFCRCGDRAFGDDVRSAGDLDGDTFGDMVAGLSSMDRGLVNVLYGPLVGSIDVEDPDVQISNDAGGTQLGMYATTAGDQDGDGRPDLLFGEFTDHRFAWVVHEVDIAE